MAKYAHNSGKVWTTAENRVLRALARETTPVGVIALKLGRTKAAVRSHAANENIPLKPTRRSLLQSPR
jgi:hypothetical protein